MTSGTEAAASKDLSWEGRSIELGDIERELNRLWQEVVGGAHKGPAPLAPASKTWWSTLRATRTPKSSMVS
ncbi:MAG: hypothetical protein WKH64_12115 [Chloroflexia bacterium]